MEKKKVLMTMGGVIQITGLTPRQVRYYEEIGLIHPSRTAGNHRMFSEEDLKTLLIIKEFKKKFSLNKIKKIIQIKKEVAKKREELKGIPPITNCPNALIYFKSNNQS